MAAPRNRDRCLRDPRPIKSYSSSLLSIITICFVLSGAAGLIYEVLWARILGLVFGATTLAISAVLCAFMAGLALRRAFAGRGSGRLSRPRFGFGVSALVI